MKLPLRVSAYDISTQKVPYSHGDYETRDVESVPDAWIVNESLKLGIVLEIKGRKSSIRLEQLNGHANRIASYEHPYLLVITPDFSKPPELEQFEEERSHINVLWSSWNDVYGWLRELPTESNNRQKEHFLVTSMQEFLERRREVLGFQGIFFSRGFDVLEAKAILNAEMIELQPTVRKAYKDLVKRRPAITTFSQESVWDCFGVQEGFTKDLHITVGLNEKSHDISLTVPNAAKKAWTRLKTVFSHEEYEEQLFSILAKLRKKVPHLFVEFTQRHFIAQRIPVRDGYMEFNIDTFGMPFRTKDSKARPFPIWSHAVKAAILEKRRVNGQVMFKSRFYLNEAEGIDKPEFITVAKETVKGFRPLYDFLRSST